MSGDSDISQLLGLAADLRQAGPVTRAQARGVVAKGAQNIKKDWRAGWKGLKHAPRLPYAIDYDLASGPAGPEAEIGPNKDKTQGALGNLLEFGSSKNPPHPAGQAALDREEPRFIAALTEIATRVW
jgi:hypothetical protein